MYAIIDLETTGGKPENEAITEIAIYKFDGNELVDQFVSMVNPERKIQYFVTKLTGINNKMLRKAPKFYEIAKRVIEITEGCTIVAHNAAFDYRVLKKEFKRLGYDYQRSRLCTVKLSKEYIPEQNSYSLGKLCKSLHIPITNRHRASGDALATLELFKLILNKNRDLSNRIETDEDLLTNKRLPKDIIKMLDNLPTKKGILYLFDENDLLISVNNTKNIQSKVKRIYLNNNPKSIDLQKQLDKIEFEIIAGKLINKVITWHYRYQKKPRFSVCTKKNFKSLISFPIDNFIIIDKGHHPGEKSIIYIENNKVYGYGFYKLNWQKQNIDLIKQRLTRVDNHPYIRKIIFEQIESNSLEIINLDNV